MKKTIERNDHGHIIIKTRHSVLVCEKTDAHDHSCNCAKQLFIHRKGQPIKRETAGTNDLISAKARAREILAGWTPAAQELAERKAADRRDQVLIAEAISDFLADFQRRHRNPAGETAAECKGANRTYDQYRLLLETFLLTWVEQYNATQPPAKHLRFITDLTPTVLVKWTGSWTWGDLTCKTRLVIVKTFFSWLTKMGRLHNNPAVVIVTPKELHRGNRTTIFSHEQYAAILKAIGQYTPNNLPLRTIQNWPRRLHVFAELMRWTGMAIVDAVLFQPSCIDAQGTLIYQRHKTKVTAVIPLASIAPHLVTLLRDIPLDDDSVGAEQPFRTKGRKLMSDTRKWSDRFADVFRSAGIGLMVNSVGRMRKPHPHMFRDTFASYCLNDLDLELPDVAKMLGHSNSHVTETSYWPWVKQRGDALARRVREARSVYLRRQKQEGKVVSIAQEASAAWA